MTSMLVTSIIFGILGVVGVSCLLLEIIPFTMAIPSGVAFIFTVFFAIMYKKEKEYDKMRREKDRQLRLVEQKLKQEMELKRQEAMKLAAQKKAMEYDIKPNRPYDKAVAELERKISTSSDERKIKLYKAILKVLKSKQYLVQKRVMLNTRFFEQCIDFWPAMFDGIDCKVDDNGNGIPDDEENGADYFEVSKPKATKNDYN